MGRDAARQGTEDRPTAADLHGLRRARIPSVARLPQEIRQARGSGLDPTDWSYFTLPTFDFAAFPPGSRVLDVGCGSGEQLRMLRKKGIEAIGIEPRQEVVKTLVAEGYDVRRGVAEQLPLSDASCDGLICKVVVPYTDERK